MERGLSNELATLLKRHIADNEDWLIKRILFYAKKQGYTAYTSTLEEAWRASISGLSRPILETPSTSFHLLELHPHFEFMHDTYAEFGVLEAKRHRERGIDLIMFMGLFKYYRQTYEDLLFRLELSVEEIKDCRTFLKRYFDRVELGFLDEWMKVDADDQKNELSDANRRLVNEKSLYLTTLESLRQPVLVLNSQGMVRVMNEAAAELFAGHSSPGAVYYGGQRTDVQPALMHKATDFLRGHVPELTFTHIISSQVFEVTFTRMKDVSGKFIGLAVILNDITERRKAEDTLEESESVRKAFMEGLGGAALVLDMESGTVVDYNSKVLEVFTERIAESGFSDKCPLFYETIDGEPSSIFQLAETSVNNEERMLDLCAMGMKSVRLFSIDVWFQNRKHKIVIIFDITREKMLEKRANHLQQLEVLGDIAGSLPCMIGESVQNILLALDRVYEMGRGDSALADIMPEISKALDDAGMVNELIGALASLVSYETESACIDMNQLVRNCVILSRDKWHPYADIDLSLSGAGRGDVYCSPDEMGQVFLNLIMNSAYAIRKKCEAEGERGLIKIVSRYGNGFYELKISDTGIGIKKKDYKKIFDPGFSTKEVGRVTGNGLAIVYDILVKRHKGTIEFTSTEGKGTEFTLRMAIK